MGSSRSAVSSSGGGQAHQHRRNRRHPPAIPRHLCVSRCQPVNDLHERTKQATSPAALHFGRNARQHPVNIGHGSLPISSNCCRVETEQGAEDGEKSVGARLDQGGPVP